MLRRIALVGCSLAFGSVESCANPTQVKVTFTTNACELDRMQVFTETGAPRVDLDLKPLRPKSCTGQTWRIGDLVFVPSGRGDRFSVTVKSTTMMGNCDADQPTGCIQASRRIAYQSHASLDLPIFLSTVCLDKKCPQGQSCSPDDGECHEDVVSMDGGWIPPPDAAPPPMDAGRDQNVIDAGPPTCSYPLPGINPGKLIHEFRFDEALNDTSIFDSATQNKEVLMGGYAHKPSPVSSCGNMLTMNDTLPLVFMGTKTSNHIGMAAMVRASNGAKGNIVAAANPQQSSWSISLVDNGMGAFIPQLTVQTVQMMATVKCNFTIPTDGVFHLLEIVATGTSFSCSVDNKKPSVQPLSPAPPSFASVVLGSAMNIDVDDLRLYDAP